MAKKTKEKKRERTERRFLPQSSLPPALVTVTGGLGAMALGAGLMGQFGRPDAVPYASWVSAAGLVLAGAAVWMGTSGDAALRVGAGGIAVEKGGTKRMPWWCLEELAWDAAASALSLRGKDEHGAPMTLRVSTKTQPQAAAWIVKEARARVPDVVHVGEDASIPSLSREAGEVLKLDPVQIVGRRCAATDRALAWEPDGRVCPRCERIYHKDHVPDACACGASLEDLRKPAEEGAA